MARPIVFGIGFNKTGTSSLHKALKMLGWKSFHNEFVMEDELKKHIDSDRPLFGNLIPKHDAFSDDPVWEHFERLDRDYPGSKFIYTVRPAEDWIASRRRHHDMIKGTNDRRPPNRKPWELDPEKQRVLWAEHTQRVRKYFEARPDDLLIFRICAGEGWERLCPFLGLPVRKDLFPWMMPGKKHAERIAKYDPKTGLQKK